MRRLLLVSMMIATAAYGCGAAGASSNREPSAKAFADAIDAYLSAHPEPVCTESFAFPFDVRADGRDDPAGAAARASTVRWLDGLAGAGLVIKARTTAYPPGDNPPVPVDEYVPSDRGAQAEEQSSRGGPIRFCVAQTRVGAIAGVRTRIKDGVTIAEVRYRPAIGRHEAWVDSQATRDAMPFLGAWLAAQLHERTATLARTADGWVAL